MYLFLKKLLVSIRKTKSTSLSTRLIWFARWDGYIGAPSLLSILLMSLPITETDSYLAPFLFIMSVSTINAGVYPPRCIMWIYRASLFLYVSASASSFSDESHCAIDSYFRKQLHWWSLIFDQIRHLPTLFLSTRLRQDLLQFSLR